jgi:hypothetical protein
MKRLSIKQRNKNKVNAIILQQIFKIAVIEKDLVYSSKFYNLFFLSNKNILFACLLSMYIIK